MNDSQFEEQTKINKDIDKQYRNYINGLILFRLRLIVAIGIVLHLSYFGLDQFAYPSYTSIFFKIRTISSIFLAATIFLSYIPKIKSHIVWLSNISASIFVASFGAMVFISNGSSSEYYQGVNLIILGLSIVNPFYLGHLICCYLLWLVYFNAVMILGHGPFNYHNLIFADYFMSSTALLVAIMTKFYKDQHYNAFIRQEQLKLNEETLSALYNQADKLSKTDTLTEINNRRNFSDMMKKKMENCEVTKTTFYLVIFDIDYFKQINDTHGHTLGDKALISVVQVVKNNIRSNDFIGRFGGDEFVICLDHPNKESLMSRLIRIRDGVRDLKLMHDGKVVPISTSIGAAKFIPGTAMTEAKLIEKADFELFNVKKTTRGEISVDQ